jgi:hypothetical protein
VQEELKRREEGALREVSRLTAELEELRASGSVERAERAEAEVRATSADARRPPPRLADVRLRSMARQAHL